MCVCVYMSVSIMYPESQVTTLSWIQSKSSSGLTPQMEPRMLQKTVTNGNLGWLYFILFYFIQSSKMYVTQHLTKKSYIKVTRWIVIN